MLNFNYSRWRLRNRARNPEDQTTVQLLAALPACYQLHVVDARQAYHRAIIRRVLREGGAHEQPPGRATDDSEVRPPACKSLLKGGPGGSRRSSEVCDSDARLLHR